MNTETVLVNITKKDILAYDNAINGIVDINKMSAMELNTFYTIVLAVAEQGSKLVIVDLTELKERIKYKNGKGNTRTFQNALKKSLRKISALSWETEINETWHNVQLFHTMAHNFNSNTVVIQVNDSSVHLFNELERTFTKFGLESFVKLNSKYSKILMPHLMQWNQLGKKSYSMEEFHELMDTPKSYQRMDNLKERVLNPIESEIGDVLSGFKVTLIKANTKGTPVTDITFTWDKNRTLKQKAEDKHKELMKALGY